METEHDTDRVLATITASPGRRILGIGALWFLSLLATAGSRERTRHELRDSAGGVLARMDEVTGLERGMFAFKPSNGFLLRLDTKKPRAWRPGLWWSLGSRIGVGGMTPAHQAKFMAEIIATLLAARDII